MLAFKYKGGISKNRIIKAFDFLKQRSDEAALAARREASMIRKQQEQQRQQQQDDADAAAAAGVITDDNGGESKTEKTEEELFGLKRAPWEKNADSTLPEGGAGLVSLMGDMSSLEQRIQGGWTLAIKAGGRCVFFVACSRIPRCTGLAGGRKEGARSGGQAVSGGANDVQSIDSTILHEVTSTDVDN